MSTKRKNFELPPALRRVLDDVRRRIRTYVWIEGVALLLVLFGLAFWVGLAADWWLEPSAAWRRAALVGLGALSLFVAYRYLLRRVFVRISDTTAALLLERRFPDLHDHLLTAVDVTSPEHASDCHPELVSQTQHAAVQAVAGIKPGELFTRAPLVRAVAAAFLLAASIVAFAFLSRDAFGFWLQRIALSDEPWPRRVSLDVVGFPPDVEGKRVHKLAQEDDFELLVHANARGFEIPDEVEIRFRLADGRRGRDTMIRVGDAVPGRDEFQLYRYEFKRVAGDMTFDVVGGDDRVRNLELRVVDRPELFAIELECVYPAYLERESRRLPVTGGMRIPEGSRIVLHATSTKPLTSARIRSSQNQSDNPVAFTEAPQEQLRWEYGTLTEDDVLMISVTDTDSVTTREPYRVSLGVVRDEVPQVAVRLAGIGAAITSDAILPFKGRVTDDYGLDHVWFEYQVDGGEAVSRPFIRQPAGTATLESLDRFDTRAIDESTGRRDLELRPGQRISLSLKAADRFDLSEEPHAGSSPQFTLEVVTMAELLARLERRELQLRQRFEAIYEKVTDTRNLIARVNVDGSAAGDAGAMPTSTDVAKSENENEESPTGTESPIATAERALGLRRLRIARSLQNSVQSADEISGVAESFDDLHDELTNNRIDNPDLKSRLREQIAQPLHRIGAERMPQLSKRLELIEQHLQDTVDPTEFAKTLALADEILVEMRQVLDRMLELETYNEVVSLLRGIISDQQEISRQTKQLQKERLESLFEDSE
jgi:hypothetical protein